MSYTLLHTVCAENEKHLIELGNTHTENYLSIDLNGGAMVDFRLTKENPNPFSWNIPIAEMPENNRKGAAFQGHFLCLGRWGSPTMGEMKAGVPHNGQSGNQMWNIVSFEGKSYLHIRSKAPLDGIVVNREIDFDEQNTIFKVTDRIQSTISIGRPFNVVQHATIGPPFLSENTIIDSNAERGFMQHLSYPNPHKFEYVWPHAIIDTLGRTINLTRTDIQESYVSTHLFNDTIGWVTASNADNGLLLGYIWKTKEYPWINIWNEMKDGKPWAKGLEFGTAGIGQSYQDLLAVDTRFHGANSFFYLDALEEVDKSFLCFQVRIPQDYKGVSKIKIQGNKIVLIEKDVPDSRSIVIVNRYYPWCI
ncbi:hypothetical protein D0T56_09895 [Dysgonomonas sp. 520]|nr:hypothetical protein [Dysgonomonas sp. 520]